MTSIVVSPCHTRRVVRAAVCADCELVPVTAEAPAREPSGCERCGGRRIVQKLSGVAPCWGCRGRDG